jgi:anti-sigma B factor antagonist
VESAESDQTLRIVVDPRADELVVAVSGEVDMASAHRMATALRDACDRSARVSLDLADLTFMDSSGFNELQKTARRARRCGSTFQVINASPEIRRLLRLTGLDRVVDLR